MPNSMAMRNKMLYEGKAKKSGKVKSSASCGMTMGKALSGKKK